MQTGELRRKKEFVRVKTWPHWARDRGQRKGEREDKKEDCRMHKRRDEVCLDEIYLDFLSDPTATVFEEGTDSIYTRLKARWSEFPWCYPSSSIDEAL